MGLVLTILVSNQIKSFYITKGQLAMENDSTINTPIELTALDDIKVDKIFAGEHTSFILPNLEDKFLDSLLKKAKNSKLYDTVFY